MKLGFSAEIERCLAPQERFEHLRRDALARFGPRLLDLSYANPEAGPDPRAVAAIRSALDGARASDLQYTPYGGSTITRRMVADRLSATHGERFHWRDVVLTPGAMAALAVVFRALRTGGVDEVVVVTPCWLDVPLYLANLGLVTRLVPVDAETLRLDVDAIAAALGDRTRAVVLAQPANPTGIVYRDDELRRLAATLARLPARPLLVSDECHRDVLVPGAVLASPLASYAETCVVYSFGKALLLQGQRIGYVAVSPRMAAGRELALHLERACRMMGLATPTSLMQIAIRDLLEPGPAPAGLADKRARVVNALAAAGYRVVPPDGTFFVYARAPAADDFAFATELATRGVLVLPSTLFHHPGWFRISLTAADPVIDAALPILVEAAR